MEKTENLHNLWVDLKTIAELKQITTRALRISLQKDKYVFRDVKTQGGKRNPTRVKAKPETRPSEGFDGVQIL
jgi:uncharacterized protein YerC